MFNPKHLLAAAAFVATASAAYAAPSAQLISMGSALLEAPSDQALSAAIQSAYSTGGSTDPASLAENAYDEIAAIIAGVTATAQWSDAQAHVEGAIGLADSYAYDDSDEDALRLSRLAANWTALVVDLALEDLEDAGLQGAGAYALMAGYSVAFRQEVIDITDALGESNSYNESQLADAIEAQLDHLSAMDTVWSTVADELYPLFDKRVSTTTTTFYKKKNYAVCFDGPYGEVCSASTFTCVTTRFGFSNITSCNSDATPTAQANALRDDQLDEDEAAIFGSDFLHVVAALEAR